MKKIAIYETQEGMRPFNKWLDSLRDRVTVARINARLTRVGMGHFGDTKPVGGGVMELKLSFAGGLRIYYGLDANTLVILLMGGDKSTQRQDIRLAHNYWSDYLRRIHGQDQ